MNMALRVRELTVLYRRSSESRTPCDLMLQHSEQKFGELACHVH